MSTDEALIIKLPDRQLRIEVPRHVKVLGTSFKRITKNNKKPNKYDNAYKIKIVWNRSTRSKNVREEIIFHVSKGIKSVALVYNGGDKYSAYISKNGFTDIKTCKVKTQTIGKFIPPSLLNSSEYY